MYSRYALDIFIFVLLIFAPWWLFAGALVCGSFMFASYYEIVLFSLLYDLIYSRATGPLASTATFTIIGTIIFFILQVFRHNFNLHEKKITKHW
ncbi:MAG: hypothetical protein WC764_04015 [Candidatus Paceibacterota bacterium]|jgi:hypothetical protein